MHKNVTYTYTRMGALYFFNYITTYLASSSLLSTEKLHLDWCVVFQKVNTKSTPPHPLDCCVFFNIIVFLPCQEFTLLVGTYNVSEKSPDTHLR